MYKHDAEEMTKAVNEILIKTTWYYIFYIFISLKCGIIGSVR